ncbi:MAG: hypothetical protein OXU21_05545 [Chloroflexota bacterium]|nr:hypothetical protein [Chloroflexota bacterium]
MGGTGPVGVGGIVGDVVGAGDGSTVGEAAGVTGCTGAGAGNGVTVTEGAGVGVAVANGIGVHVGVGPGVAVAGGRAVVTGEPGRSQPPSMAATSSRAAPDLIAARAAVALTWCDVTGGPHKAGPRF